MKPYVILIGSASGIGKSTIASEISNDYCISKSKTASILDTFSCFFQGIIPYGAQMLVAISTVVGLGGEISAFMIIPKLFYPYLLLISALIFIFFVPSKKESK